MAIKLNNQAFATIYASISAVVLPHQAVGDPRLAVLGERLAELTQVAGEAHQGIIQI